MEDDNDLAFLDPVAALTLATVFLDATILFDSDPGTGNVLIASDQVPGNPQIAGNRQVVIQRPGRVTPAALGWPHTASNAASFIKPEIIEFVAEGKGAKGHPPANCSAARSKQKS